MSLCYDYLNSSSIMSSFSRRVQDLHPLESKSISGMFEKIHLWFYLCAKFVYFVWYILVSDWLYPRPSTVVLMAEGISLAGDHQTTFT